MAPRMHVKQLFHVIVKHAMATETSADYQPGNIGPLGALSTHRAQNFQHDFFSFFKTTDGQQAEQISKHGPLFRALSHCVCVR